MQTFPTTDELYAMPLKKLRNIDIRTKEQEEKVQAVINSKLLAEPVKLKPNKIRVPDIKTKEQEEYWQKILDAEKERIQALKPVNSNSPTEIKTAKRFCEHCDSKGVRHKKICTRPK